MFTAALTEVQLEATMFHNLTGDAREWFLSEAEEYKRRSGASILNNWNHLRGLFADRFCRMNPAWSLELLRHLQQRPDGSVADLAQRAHGS
jgi:hypothetical protein